MKQAYLEINRGIAAFNKRWTGAYFCCRSNQFDAQINCGSHVVIQDQTCWRTNSFPQKTQWAVFFFFQMTKTRLHETRLRTMTKNNQQPVENHMEQFLLLRFQDVSCLCHGGQASGYVRGTSAGYTSYTNIKPPNTGAKWLIFGDPSFPKKLEMGAILLKHHCHGANWLNFVSTQSSTSDAVGTWGHVYAQCLEEDWGLGWFFFQPSFLDPFCMQQKKDVGHIKIPQNPSLNSWREQTSSHVHSHLRSDWFACRKMTTRFALMLKETGLSQQR